MPGRMLGAGLRTAPYAIGAALVARALMRLVALDTLGEGTFSVVGTAGICLLFLLSGVGAAIGRSLTERRWVLVPVVLLTSALLWESDVAIGLTSFEDARAMPMTLSRWVGFWMLFALISALAVLTPYIGVRTAGIGAGVALRGRPNPVALDDEHGAPGRQAPRWRRSARNGSWSTGRRWTGWGRHRPSAHGRDAH
jgi:hypothetical protein